MDKKSATETQENYEKERDKRRITFAILEDSQSVKVQKLAELAERIKLDKEARL